MIGRMRSDHPTTTRTPKRIPLLARCALAALLGACGSSGDPSPSSGAGAACSTEIRIGLFSNDTCDGEPVLVVDLPLEQPCVGWDRQVRQNSATRFQCWRDRLCYTQYVSSFTCDASEAMRVEDKESWTHCTKDPTPNIWTRILSGTEQCPEAPADFACPISGEGTGNTEVAACS